MLLLDTCSLIWLASHQEQLSATAKKEIEKQANNLFVSAISAFEIAIKVQKKLLQLQYSADHWYHGVLKHHSIIEIPISGNIITCAVALPPLHKDPCDRIIIATAQSNHGKIVTPDKHIHAYPHTQIVW